jgi:metal-responsive CopG/Arc/MetJ family transcriptional regulator
MNKAGRPPSTRKKANKFSISLRADVYEKLEAFVEATGLDRSGVISLLIQRTEISSIALDPKKPTT